MSDRDPEFDELVGDARPAERSAARRARAADRGRPAARAPARAEESPRAAENVYPLFPRRYRAPRRLSPPLPRRPRSASATSSGARRPTQERIVGMAAAGGAATLARRWRSSTDDEAGNWPMELTVRGLPRCGVIGVRAVADEEGQARRPVRRLPVASDTTEVPLNAPYRLKDYDGWVIVRTGTTTPVLTT